MRYALLQLLPILLLTACAQSPSEGDTDTGAAENPTTAVATEAYSNNDFVEACLKKTNWERLLCECVDAKAKEDLSDDGYAFQIASLREDEDEIARLRERMSLEEIVQAGMFMVNASRECAEDRP